jgi:hypothetical protein
MAVLAWLFTAALTLITLRSHLGNIRQNRLLSASAARIRESEELARLTLDTAPVALILVATEPCASCAPMPRRAKCCRFPCPTAQRWPARTAGSALASGAGQ